MEQATAGKVPPPIAINSSGGGIQILNMNMNAVRGAASVGGATVVPSSPVPGVAQSAGTMVGSPGPPGKGAAMPGPRMISLTPQMLANHHRPGQPLSSSNSLHTGGNSAEGDGGGDNGPSPVNNNNIDETMMTKGSKTNCDDNSNRPSKLMPLMDVNLADFMFIDCDDEIDGIGSGSGTGSENNNNRLWVTPTIAPPEGQHNNSKGGGGGIESAVPSETSSSFMPTKPSEEFAPRLLQNMEESSPRKESLPVLKLPVTSSTFDGSSAWTNRRIESFAPPAAAQHHQSPSTAFQMHTIGQQQQQHHQPGKFHNLSQQQVAARIPMRSEPYAQHHQQQHHHPLPNNSYGPGPPSATNTPASYSQPHLNMVYGSSSNHHGGVNGSVAVATPRDPNPYSSFIRANNNNSVINTSSLITPSNSLNSEYKMNSNSRSQHLQSCFTNDPQLHSQFVQYTQTYPLGQRGTGASDVAAKGSMVPFSQAAVAAPLAPVPVPRYQQQPSQQQPLIQRPRFHLNLNQNTFGRPQSQVVSISLPQQQHHVVRHPVGVPPHQHHQVPVPQPHLQPSSHSQILRPQSQTRPFQPQPQYRQCSNYIPNGCDNSNKQVYYPGNMQQVYRPGPEVQARPNHHNYIAHNQPATSVRMSATPIAMQQQHHHLQSANVNVGNHAAAASVIRPNIYSGGSVLSTTSSNNVSTITSNSSNSNIHNTYGANNYYGANQASVIRAHQSSNSSSSGSSTSSSVLDKDSGYHFPSAGLGVGGGELTLQSFLSNPSAPFMCPPPSSSSSTAPQPSSSHNVEHSSTRSGYYNNESWDAPSVSRADQGFSDQEQYRLSSCQYSDAMRRNNAPITLQALSGLPPGANHLLVKTENGQFQLVSVRMQSPTAAAAAPGTPGIPSTVAAPPTSMSIAQQLPSSSPLAPPPLPPHSASSGPLVPPLSSSLITTTTIPPHPSQQGRIITSSSSNHIVTSWSSSNNNSLVNNNSITSSPLPMMMSTSAAPHPPPHPHPHPSSLPSSVIMPPNLSANHSQLLISTANNISSSTSTSSIYSTAANAAVAAAATAYQQRNQPALVSGNVPGGPPPPMGVGLPPPPLPNSIPNVMTPPIGSMNNLPPGASVIRSGVMGGGSLPPPPPPVIVSGTTSSYAASSVTSSSLVTSTPSAPTGPATFRPQSAAASQVPNNNASNNAQSGGMGMMMTGSNSNAMSVHPHHHHQIHPPYSQLHPNPTLLPHAPHHHAPPSPSYASKSVSPNSTANTVSQMSNETAKNKCKNFLSFLLELSAKQNQTVARNVKSLIQGLIDGKVNEETFADRLQKEVNSQPQPCLVGFLKKSLPHLRHSLATNELKIEGIKPPPLSTLVPPAPVTALVPQTPPTPTERKPKFAKQTPPVRPTTPTVPPNPVRIATPPVNSASPSTPGTPASSSGASAPSTPTPSPSSTKASKSKGSSSKSKSSSAKAAALAAAAAAAAASNDLSSSGASSLSSTGPGGTPSTKSSIPSSKSSKEKEKKDKTFSSSGYADDDINDVAAMGGVNLAEESQRILGSTEYVGTQIRSCRDETMIQASPILAKFKVIAAKHGLDEAASSEVSTLLSHAVEEKLKTMIEKLSVIAEHRMDVIKLDERYEITQDVKGQLKFLEELDKLEKKRHDEQEREILIRAAKSRSKSEDPEQAKLKAKAKEMQRVALEEMRQRDANLTALQAIGPRKKPKLDISVGSHGSVMPSPLGSTGASSSLGRSQIPLRPRLKRVNLRDLLFLLEHDKETMRSPFLYKNLLLK